MIVNVAAIAAVTTGLVFGGALTAQAAEYEETEPTTGVVDEPITFVPIAITLDNGDELVFNSQEEIDLAIAEALEVAELVRIEQETVSMLSMVSDDEGTEPIAPVDPIPEPEEPEPEPEPLPDPEEPVAPVPVPDPKPTPPPTPSVPNPAPAPSVQPADSQWSGASVKRVSYGGTAVPTTRADQLAYTGGVGTASLFGAAVALLGGGCTFLYRSLRGASKN